MNCLLKIDFRTGCEWFIKRKISFDSSKIKKALRIGSKKVIYKDPPRITEKKIKNNVNFRSSETKENNTKRSFESQISIDFSFLFCRVLLQRVSRLVYFFVVIFHLQAVFCESRFDSKTRGSFYHTISANGYLLLRRKLASSVA